MTTLTDASAGRRTGSTRTAEKKLDKALLVRTAVADCATELQKSPAPGRRARRHIPGCNPDATPC